MIHCLGKRNQVFLCLSVAKKSNHWKSWRRKLIVLNMGDVDLKRTPEGNNKVRRNVSIERSQLSCAEWLWGSHRTQVTLGAQPACACCLKWPTDPLSACSSSGLPRRASAGGRRGESKRGLDTREGGKKAKARDARNWRGRGGGQTREEEKPGIFQLFEAWHKGLTAPAWSSRLPAQRCPPTTPRKLPSTLGRACASARMCHCSAGNLSLLTDIVPVTGSPPRSTERGGRDGASVGEGASRSK